MARLPNAWSLASDEGPPAPESDHAEHFFSVSLVNLVPRSLLARTFLSIALVLVLAMGAWFALVRTYEYEPRALAASRMIVSVVNLTRSALVTAQPDLRRSLLVDLAEREGIRVYPAELEDRIDPLPAGGFLGRVETLTREALGRDTRFGVARDSTAALWVSFRIDEDDYWVTMDPDRLNPPLTRQLAGWGLLALALALAGAFLIV